MSIIDTADYSVYVQAGDGFEDVLIDVDLLQHVSRIKMFWGDYDAALGFSFLCDGRTYIVEGRNQHSFLGIVGTVTKRKANKLLDDPKKYDPDLCRLRRDLLRHL